MKMEFPQNFTRKQVLAIGHVLGIGIKWHTRRQYDGHESLVMISPLGQSDCVKFFIPNQHIIDTRRPCYGHGIGSLHFLLERRPEGDMWQVWNSGCGGQLKSPPLELMTERGMY